jgi:predicted TIM-barrel fold metal-dependent hydrolase
MSQMPGATVRARLSHPVIDADGHQLEFEPLLRDYLRAEGGEELVGAAERGFSTLFSWYQLDPHERHRQRAVRPPWGLQSHSVDHIAKAMFPPRLYRALDEVGIDVQLVYPTLGVALVRAAPAESRLAMARAINTYSAELFRPYQDRLIPAATVPMSTPEDAIAALDHAVGELGHRIIVIDCATRRPVEAARDHLSDPPREIARFLTWLDSYGLDSAHDYDPFWRRCIERKVAVTAHQAGMWGARTSISNYVHNHLGMFGAAGEALCKSLFLGGVTFRFPELRVALLEGGAGWACSLYAGLVEHWEKRNREAVADYDPARLDLEALWRRARESYPEACERLADGERAGAFAMLHTLAGWIPEAGWDPPNDALLDEFRRCRIGSPEDIRDHFVDNFFFGCEAEDPSVLWATDGKLPLGARLRILFGSDIGHWDVPDMTRVLGEAYEFVERGDLSETGFRDFVFANAVRLHGGANPAFFDGTVVEGAAREVLGGSGG